MKITLCTLVLNEMEWLEKLYTQHKDFPNLEKWIFVEAADRMYQETNPHLVSDKGLSVDNTSIFLQELSVKDERITYIPHGLSCHSDKAQGKCEARDRYLEEMENIHPDYFLQLDADEFWPKEDQSRLEEWITSDPNKYSFSFRHREIWHPPSIKDEPLFQYEVVGGFWDILYCRVFKWMEGIRYVNNHNTPSLGNELLTTRLKDHRRYQWNSGITAPQFIHMGFAVSDIGKRIAKNNYYCQRGESVDNRRKWYTKSRECFATWKPNDILPNGAEVIAYNGPIPEIFLNEKEV